MLSSSHFPGHRLALVDTNVVPPAPVSFCQLEVLQPGLLHPVLKSALPRFSRSSLHRNTYSKINIFLSVAVAFIISSTFPVIVISNNAFTFYSGKYICTFDCNKLGVPMCLPVQGILIITCFGPIVYCHIGIFRSVRHHNARLATSKEARDQEKTPNMQVDHMKVTKLLFSIVIAFSFCWSPFIVITGVSLLTGHYWMPREVYMTSTYLACYSSSVRPCLQGGRVTLLPG